MSTSSVDLVLELAADTARAADQSGDGMSGAAASAMIEIIGQVRTYNSFDSPSLTRKNRQKTNEMCKTKWKCGKGRRLIGFVVAWASAPWRPRGVL